MIASPRWSIACALALFACAGPAPEPPPGATAGGEAPSARERPTGPVRSYVDESDRVVVRIDMEAVRGSTLAADIGSMVRSYPMWRALLGSSGIDPVRDFDRVLVAAPEAIADRSVIVIRHHLGNARIREAVLSMAVERGARPQWREVEGFPVVDWPAETEVPRVVVLTSENELVVATPDALDRVIAVARDHAARRRQADELVEPALQLEEGLIASMVADRLGESARRFRHPPDALQVSVRSDGSDERRISLTMRGTYPDDGSAEAARRWLSEQRNAYANHVMVRMIALDRALREATIGGEGNVVEVHGSFTEEEMQRVLGLVALGQIAGS